MNRPKAANRAVQSWVTSLLLMLSCGGVGEYMPMGTGSWWEYSVEVYETVGAIVREDYRDLRYAEITFQEESETHGRMTLFTKVMDDVNTTYSYYMSAEGGALTTYQDIESPSGEEYLREPIETGTGWMTHTRQDTGVVVTGEILDNSERLNMSLWTFDDCVHVRLVSNRELQEQYPGTETVTWDMWFVKGVGMVRSVLVNENPTWLYRKTVTQELLNYSIE
jgi:hypothetical protein